MAVQVGKFPPWTVDSDDIRIVGVNGREFAIKCHVTPGMGEVVALMKDASGAWQYAMYMDDYVDGHFADMGGDVKKYLAWLVTRIQAWLDSVFKPISNGQTPTPTPAPTPTGEPIDQVHAALKTLKFTANADGTFTVKL